MIIGCFLASQDEQEYTGFTDLMLACRYDLPVVAKILARGDEVNAVNSCGETALIYACYNTPKYVPLLLVYGTDFNVVSANGNTALHFACQYNPEVVIDLIDAGADVNVKNNAEYTPLMIIKQKDDFLTLQFLLQSGATNK